MLRAAERLAVVTVSNNSERRSSALVLPTPPWGEFELTPDVHFNCSLFFCLAPIFCLPGVCSRFDIRKACSWFCLPSCRGTSKPRLREGVYRLARLLIRLAIAALRCHFARRPAALEERRKKRRSGDVSDCAEAHGGSVERRMWEDRELPGEMARKEKKGYDACYAQSSSSPYDDDDDGGGCRTNKVCFASSTSRTHHRRLPNSSAQSSNTKHTDIHHCKTSAFSIDSSHPVLETFEAHRLPFKQ